MFSVLQQAPTPMDSGGRRGARGHSPPAALSRGRHFEGRKYGILKGLVVWLSGNALVVINEVTLRQARLILGWVTVCMRAGKPSRYVTSHLGRLSLLPSVGR